jgi:hypothetical protein
MAWIKTIPHEEANDDLRDLLAEVRRSYPEEYAVPATAASADGESIVQSHTLIPNALFHAFSTYSSLLDPELPLSRRDHEMIATVVSAVNRCHY